jgi:hypothetical protein
MEPDAPDRFSHQIGDTAARSCRDIVQRRQFLGPEALTSNSGALRRIKETRSTARGRSSQLPVPAGNSGCRGRLPGFARMNTIELG